MTATHQATAVRPSQECTAPHQAAFALGIDLAHYDGSVDWRRVLEGGMAFAFVKATDGVSFTDPLFAENWQHMGEVGITRGTYHLIRGNEDAAQQAELFLSRVSLAPTDMPPVLDLEASEGVSRAAFVHAAHAWLDAVEAKAERTPIVYVSPGFAAEHLDSSFGRYPLWVAHYTMHLEPLIPPGWTDWTFWQYASAESGHVHVPGVLASVDADRFHGSHAELVALFGL